MSANYLVDLTVPARTSGQGFSDDEDEAAFGYEVNNRRIYKHQIWYLRKNDPNFGLLGLDCAEMSEEICARVGIYLWPSRHIKMIRLSGLTGIKIGHLFGNIASQNETNDYVLKSNVLGQIVGNEQTLVKGIIESVTSFPHLRDVTISGNNIGQNGLDVLVKALAGSPIQELGIFCDLEGITPLSGLQKCQRLEKLNISGNRVGFEDVATLSMLFNGYPRLRELHLNNCGIGDDLLEMISPFLAKNKSLTLLFLCNKSDEMKGARNNIGGRGVQALSKAVHDSSSFEDTLASNHTISKILLSNPEFGDRLFQVTRQNCFDERYCHHVAWEKYTRHFVESTSADMSPFLHMEIKLIPHIIARRCAFPMQVIYKIWSCKSFRERIDTASQITNLQTKNECLTAKMEELVLDNKRNEQLEDENSKLVAENKRLKEVIAKMVVQNVETNKKPESSIAERVKTRKNVKRTRFEVGTR